MIFDQLEMANQPTLQTVIPNHYPMMKDTRTNKKNYKIIKELKAEIRYCLDEKSFSSILPIHWVGTYSDRSFKSFVFVSDCSYLEAQKKKFRKGLHILAGDVIEHLYSSHSSQRVSSTSPASKGFKK